jgi:hypothetical protein
MVINVPKYKTARAALPRPADRGRFRRAPDTGLSGRRGTQRAPHTFQRQRILSISATLGEELEVEVALV